MSTELSIPQLAQEIVALITRGHIKEAQQKRASIEEDLNTQATQALAIEITRQLANNSSKN